jgi:hypothetical protein
MIEAFKIGVEIALRDSMSSALAAISSKLLGIHTKVGEIEKGIGKWGPAILGVSSIMAGAGILKGLKSIAEHGEELLHQQDMVVRAQGKAVGVQEAHRRAVELTAEAYKKILPLVPTATASDALRTANEMYSVTGSWESAKNSIVKSLQLEALVGNATGKDAAGQGYNVWRAAEIKGVSQDEKATDRLFGLITQAIIASGGKVTGSGIYGFAKQAGPAWMLANDRALTGGIPYAIGELGGDKAGTASQSMYNVLQGTRRWTRQQYDVWKKLGLIDPSHVQGDRGGKLNLQPGAVRGALEYAGDLEGYVNQVIRPAFDKAHITDPKMVNAVLAKMFPDRTAARLAEIYYAQQANIEKDRALNQGAMPLGDAYKEMVEHDPKAVMESFNKAFNAMLEAIGGPLMQAAIPAMIKMTEFFHTVGQFANEHQNAIKIAGEALAVIAVGLIAIGAVSLATLVAVPAAIAGAVAALGALIAFNWDAFKAGVQAFDNFIDAIPNYMNKAIDQLIRGLDGIAGAIASFVATLWEKVKAAFGFGGGAPAQGYGGGPVPAQPSPSKPESGSSWMWHPSSFNGYPQRDQKPITTVTAVNMDGEVVARIVQQRLVDMHENSASASTGNGVALLDRPGFNPSFG